MRTREAEGASIIMIGSFNPAIFQPRWLEMQRLIRTEEAENAKITTIQAQVADFSTEWFQLQVLQQRFTVSTTTLGNMDPSVTWRWGSSRFSVTRPSARWASIDIFTSRHSLSTLGMRSDTSLPPRSRGVRS